MRRTTKRSAAIVTAAVVAAGGGAGAAWAAWFSKGSATAGGTAGSLKPLVVSGAKLIGDPLVPGNKAGVEFKVRNENNFPVAPKLLSIGNFTSDNKNCDAAHTFTQVVNAPIPSSITGAKVDPGQEATFTWPGAVQLTEDPDDDCQGQKFFFVLTISAATAGSAPNLPNPHPPKLP